MLPEGLPSLVSLLLGNLISVEGGFLGEVGSYGFSTRFSASVQESYILYSSLPD